MRLINIIIAIMMSFLLLSCSKATEEKQEPRPIPAVKVGVASQYEGRAFPGKAKATQEVDLAFNVSGTLEKRPIDVGTVVKKGQLVAQLDQRDFISKLNSAKATYNKNRQNLARATQLVKNFYISQADYDRIKAATDVSRAEAEIAKKALDDSTLLAPFDGNISRTFVEKFQSVKPKEPIARLIDTAKVEMIINVPESLISDIRYVVKVNVKYDSFPKEVVTATIKEVSNEASEVTRTYPVTLIMDQPKDFKILPGMAGVATAVVELPSGHRSASGEGIVVPVSAVFSPDTDKQNYIWIISPNNMEVRKSKVTVSKISSNGAYVTTGVNVGDWVVTAGVHSLKEGQQVKPMKQQE